LTKNKHDITTVLGKNVHEIVRKYSDQKKYDEYRNNFEKAKNLKFIPEYPIQIDFELNYSCNFSCSMCTWSVENAKGRGKSTWFNFKAFKEIIDEGVDKGLKAIRLNYINEPLIRKDIIDFIDYAKKKGVLDIYLSTNGSLLTNKISKDLILSGLTRLQVSIDAFSKKTFDQIRQGGDFTKVIKNTENFINLRNSMSQELPTVRVNFVRTHINKLELDPFIKFWIDKADCIGIQDLVDIMNLDNNKSQLKKKKFQCNQPFYHLTVRYDGSLLPCCTFFAAKLPLSKLKVKEDIEFSKSKNLHNLEGNLKKKSIEETWKSDEINLLRSIHKSGEYFKNDICKECVLSTSNIDDSI
jgi:MoaA/NifB/PqqE/SkfB family radical SAM enzyme